MNRLLNTRLQVEGFGNDPARGSEAGAALVKWGLVGRIGVGRGWQDDEETFYHLKDAVSLIDGADLIPLTRWRL